MKTDSTTSVGASDVRFVSVEKSFETATALHSLDLEIERGTLFALLGPSGCGKTTTLRLIAGFEQPTRGQVYIRGKDVTGIPAYKRSFGMVFQNFALFPHLSVTENVAFGLQMRGIGKDVIRQKVAAVLDLVALGKFADRYPRQLSGGQQQRVALARAVVFEPDVLLLDEPLSALDKMLREQMQVEIRQLQHRLGMTTVFVTHDQEEALTMSDRVAVMNHGRIQQAGTPKDIYDRPRTEFVATFLGASNILEGHVRGREGDRAVVDVAGNLIQVSGTPVSKGKLRFALRPEKIVLDPQSGIRAVVKDVIYRGAQTFLYLDMGGIALNAVLQNTAATPADIETGTSVGLSWETASAVALEDPT
ncbi:putative spermidine/putrescine transport system ATP-binding protein/spermidine/putrescine transport system ATP-binding protein [Rhizobium petrolearium]|uniref:ABC transporter ATP-binding protein n=1 Tax=Neorhizobium petrolearium TaxID=515361 RepID=UPI001F269FD3|nr:ABC transporter ATP-binding protein [Neorhizobium petrolearium]MBP1845750.1 putative spermidine/putrescine transport system ATP-binding protein/spermidine/putrescine transport system ATP-binding protein [Neorhizobium petrolearium]